MKFISKPLEWVLFTVLFFCVVLPLGYLLRTVADPHRLARQKTSASYFNRLPTPARSQRTVTERLSERTQ
jgi:hypothetical protein